MYNKDGKNYYDNELFRKELERNSADMIKCFNDAFERVINNPHH